MLQITPSALLNVRQLCTNLQTRNLHQRLTGVLDCVATLVINAGPLGGSQQMRLIEALEAAGFRAEFYAGSIRVSLAD